MDSLKIKILNSILELYNTVVEPVGSTTYFYAVRRKDVRTGQAGVMYIEHMIVANKRLP